MTQADFFLVLEGLDGSGKSEISRRLTAHYTGTHGERIMLTYEPYDPSVAGEYIRQALRKEIAVSNRTLALAYALNRADHIERVVTPFLSGQGCMVICDRYVLSSLVYQSTDGMSMADVWTLNAGARRPDLTIFMDVHPETSAARLAGRPQRELFDDELDGWRAKYFDAIRFLREHGQTVAVIDANGGIDEVLAAVIAALTPHLPAWLRD